MKKSTQFALSYLGLAIVVLVLGAILEYTLFAYRPEFECLATYFRIAALVLVPIFTTFSWSLLSGLLQL